jgi:hypothetical protein
VVHFLASEDVFPFLRSLPCDIEAWHVRLRSSLRNCRVLCKCPFALFGGKILTDKARFWTRLLENRLLPAVAKSVLALLKITWAA